MEKGTRVRITRGPSAGVSGTVFWSGPGKFGGVRVGITTEEGAKIWASAEDVASLDVPSTAAPRGRAAAAGTRRWPFRFYGQRPTDWIEGTSDGHAFSVQLEAEPAPDLLRRIAALYETSLDQSDAVPGRNPWQWSGRFGHFEVGERSHRRSGRVLEPVTEFLRALHAIAPIRDVVYLNAREGMSEWDAWSVRQASTPDPGPPGWAYGGLWRRSLDPALAPLAPHAVFEDARDTLRLATWKAAEEAKLDGAVAASRANKGLRLAHFEAEGPVAPSWPEADLAFFHRPASVRLPGDHFVPGIWERPIAWVIETIDGAPVDVAWLEGRERRTAALPPCIGEGELGHLQGLTGIALHPSGERVLVCGFKHLVQVVLATGEVRELPHPAPTLQMLGVAYVAGGYAVLTAGKLHLFGPRGPQGQTRVAGSHLVSVVNAPALLVDDGEQTSLYSVRDQRLANLGSIRATFGQAREHQGSLLVSTRFGQRWYEIVGAMPALAARAASPRPRAQKRASADGKPARSRRLS